MLWYESQISTVSTHRCSNDQSTWFLVAKTTGIRQRRPFFYSGKLRYDGYDAQWLRPGSNSSQAVGSTLHMARCDFALDQPYTSPWLCSSPLHLMRCHRRLRCPRTFCCRRCRRRLRHNPGSPHLPDVPPATTPPAVAADGGGVSAPQALGGREECCRILYWQDWISIVYIGKNELVLVCITLTFLSQVYKFNVVY